VSVLAPLSSDPDAALARRNPVAKLAAAGVLMLGLLVTLDAVTPAVLLLVELAAVPSTGVRWGALLRRTRPLLIGVLGVTVANLLVVKTGDPRVVVGLGPLDITAGAASAALSVALRLLAIALPGILVLASTDPTDLADSLVQRLRVSPRFAYGALAALRLLPLLAADWQLIGRARRARGLEAGRSPVAALRLFISQVFAVLVAAIRRGVRLATAMEARGFDSGGTRTVARLQPMRRADWALIGAAVAAVALATAVAVVAGSWRLLLL
jgi:energy-coupling factor transport system permease protein